VSLGVISTPTARMCYYNLTKRGALNCYHQAASVFSSLATDREMKNNMVHVHLMGVELQITPLLILYLGNSKHCAALCLIKLANWRSVIRCESADFHCVHTNLLKNHIKVTENYFKIGLKKDQKH
jgi:hypothetical protein